MFFKPVSFSPFLISMSWFKTSSSFTCPVATTWCSSFSFSSSSLLLFLPPYLVVLLILSDEQWHLLPIMRSRRLSTSAHCILVLETPRKRHKHWMEQCFAYIEKKQNKIDPLTVSLPGAIPWQPDFLLTGNVIACMVLSHLFRHRWRGFLTRGQVGGCNRFSCVRRSTGQGRLAPLHEAACLLDVLSYE